MNRKGSEYGIQDLGKNTLKKIKMKKAKVEKISRGTK
jgi:hypothetical protein